MAFSYEYKMLRKICTYVMLCTETIIERSKRRKATTRALYKVSRLLLRLGGSRMRVKIGVLKYFQKMPEDVQSVTN